jgi:hypothetical protein
MVSLADIQINRGYEPDDGADEDRSYPSMEALFAPPEIGSEDRRMQARAYSYWLAMVENGELPPVEELRPEEIADFGPNAVLVDLTLGIDRPSIVYLGALLAAECGGDREIFALDDVPERSLLSRLTEHCLEVVATRSPVGYEAEFEGRTGKTIRYRSILLPFSSDGATVDFVFGVISWKEDVASAAQQQPAPAFEPVVSVPIQNAPRLGDLLAEARRAASLAAADKVRTRDYLYQAISATYDLVVAAASDPAGFARLAEDRAGGGPTRTATVLVFGPRHDKTRLSEIIAVLAHGQRLELPRGGLYARLAAAPGGIKGLLAEERLWRRGDAPAPRSRQLSRFVAGRLRQVPARKTDAAIEDGREFGLIVARRNPDGSVTPIGDAGSDLRLLERAARRLLDG